MDKFIAGMVFGAILVVIGVTTGVLHIEVASEGTREFLGLIFWTLFIMIVFVLVASAMS